jgi:hypothetical protein
MGGVGRGIAVATVVALSACGGGSLAPSPSSSSDSLCGAGKNFALTPSGGTLTFTVACGASVTIAYSSESQIPASTTVGLTSTTQLSSFPPPVGTNAKTQAAFTITASQDVDLLSQITVDLPAGMTPSGPYGFQLFEGYGATMYSEEFSASVSGTTITTPSGAIGLLLSAGQTYILEVVQNPDIADFPPP